MSIVGASGVNLKDLEGLGVPTLTAMAQGQIKSVAPSYMVLAALKSLTDAQKSVVQPPQPTVKDQVVSQAVPVVQQGMGAAAPVAAFAGGGLVRAIANADLDPIFESISDVPEQLRQFFRARARGPGTPSVSKGTAAYETPALVQGELRYPDAIPAASTQREAEQTQPTATRASVGIASAGSSPISRYKPGKFEDKLEFTAKPEGYKLDIPKNQQLIDAHNRMSKPDEARMKEYADERRMSGLAALAQGIMQGRGLGQAIPQAAAGFVSAARGVDKERRAYEDARQRAAMELGIKMGDNERSDAIAGAEYGVKRAGVDDARAIAAHKAGLDVFTSNEAAAAKAEELRISAERNRIAAEQVTATRGAARLTAATEALRKIQTDGERIAQKAADEYLEAIQKSPQYADPNVQRMAISQANRIRAETFSKYTEANAASIGRLQQVIQEQ